MKAKKIYSLFFFFLFSFLSAFFKVLPFGEDLGGAAFSQIQNPVKWNFSVNNPDTNVGTESEAELIFKASIDRGWHMYSQHLPGDEGPIPLSFSFEKNKNYELLGKVSESKALEVFDNVFGMKLRYFENEAAFRQKVKILPSSDGKFVIKGVLTFMACDDKMCLPPQEVDFEFKIEGKSGIAVVPQNDSAHEITNDTVQKISSVPVDDETFNDDCGSLHGDTYSGVSAWSIFIQGLIAGLLALLTPCVFPMIPLTVSFFLNKGGTKRKGIINAFTYSFSIIIIYVAFGFLISKLMGSAALIEIASNLYLNLIFFLLFVIFALSFLGAFEIQLPSSWVNKLDAASEKSGFLGIALMALVLVIVSFSCTGPIIGALLVQSAVAGNNLAPLAGMTGFSIAFGLPFGILASFPMLLHGLPKSGGWLNAVKVTLAFLMLAFSLKFLSTADLAYHWQILGREVFLVIWIILFTLLGFYLLGKIKFSHDSDSPYISIPRLFLSILTFAFAIYMLPGLWGAPLNSISAFLPPSYTQDFDVMKNSEINNQSFSKKYSDIFHCPYNLNCFYDYEEGMNYAKSVNKPVCLYFTGWSCVNCKKMIASVWSDAAVQKRLRENYVLIVLYVDDKTVLPESEQTVSPFSGRKIKTIGNKWSDFQISKFQTNSQPYYVLLDNEGKKLAFPRGYTPEVLLFKQFLDEGICRYKIRNTN